MHSPETQKWRAKILRFLHLEKLPPVVRKVIAMTIGSLVLLVGLVMLVTPGPAIVLIPLGLLILGAEFGWARSWLHKLDRFVQRVRQRWQNRNQPGHT